MILKFLEPYIIFCGSSAYSLIQNMESMGWVSFWKGFFIDPHSTFILFFAAYIVFFPFVIMLSILASYSLNSKLGALTIALWLMPGVLSLFGIEFIIPSVPDSYKLNDGSMYVGETRSTLYNVFICFLLGWSTVTLFVHVLKITKNFKELYDHLWYAIGLAAAVIFVVDSNTAYYKSELAESEGNISKSLSLIIGQLKYTSSICLNDPKYLESNGISNEFCDWVNKAKFNYFWLSEEKSFTRDLKIRTHFDNLIPSNRISDISIFNNLICNSKSEAHNCDLLPFEFGSYSEEPYLPGGRFGLAIIPLNDALKVYWELSSKNDAKLKTVKNTPNTKWFFYMGLGFIAGGKVANSSRALAGSPRPIFRYWLKNIYTVLVNLYLSIQIALSVSAKFIKNGSSRLLRILFNKWL